jgi:hypothetical protein
MSITLVGVKLSDSERTKYTLEFGPNLGSTLRKMNSAELKKALVAELAYKPQPRLSMFQRIVARLKEATAMEVEGVALRALAGKRK